MQMHLHKCNNIPYILLPLNLSFGPLHRSLFSQLFQSSVPWDWYNIFLPQLAKGPLTNSNCFCTWEFGSGSWKKWEGESVRGCLGNAAVLMDAEGYAEDKVDSSKATLTKSMQKKLFWFWICWIMKTVFQRPFCENLKFPLLMWTLEGKRRQGKAILGNSARLVNAGYLSVKGTLFAKKDLNSGKGNERMVSKCASKLLLRAVQFHPAVPSTSI